MSVITTYLNDNAQTPLGRFVVYMLYSQLCNKYSDKSNRWSWGLSEASSAVVRRQLLVDRTVNWVLWMIFSNSTVVHTNMGHLSKTTSLLGVICHHIGKTWYSLPLYKIWELQPFLRYGWCPQNLKRVKWCNHAPFRDGLSSIGWD